MEQYSLGLGGWRVDRGYLGEKKSPDEKINEGMMINIVGTGVGEYFFTEILCI